MEYDKEHAATLVRRMYETENARDEILLISGIDKEP